ncbi:MAG: class I SAM-dependent DNA methyltransferase [Pseudonocardiaceae bacterium]
MIEPSYVRATRAGYDAVAADYSEWVSDALAVKPLDRALLAAFAELVHADGAGPVGDLDCGSGRVTAHLRSLGLSAFGVDLSPAMVALARRAYPDLRFDEGSITAVDAADGALGIVAWYSIIHTPPEELPVVFAEFHRALAPGGRLLLAFQVGDEPRHLAEAFGHVVSLDFYRFQPDRVAQLLHEAGLAVFARLLREPDETERVQQAYVLARKPTTIGDINDVR